MHSSKKSGFGLARLGSAGAAVLGSALALSIGASEAQAQELVHRFINPSFGGNPFYSEHLLGIAGIDRPEEPEEPGEDPPTEEELLTEQIRARLLSQLQGDILDRIEDAEPGESGEFEFGNQRISFTRTEAGTEVTFFSARTSETRRVFIPAAQSLSSLVSSSVASLSAANAASATARASSPEQALGALGASPTSPVGSSMTGLLDPRSLEVPLRGY